MSLEGKTAIIAGGAKGIGKETALAFVKAGAKVLIADFDIKSGRETLAELQQLGEA